MGQSPKNKDGPKPKKHALANAEKTIKPKGAALRAAPLGIIIFCIGQGVFFLHWPTHIFSALANPCFFCMWPILIFWALAHAHFLGFGPCLFFWMWPMLNFLGFGPCLCFFALAPACFFHYFLLPVARAGPRYF